MWTELLWGIVGTLIGFFFQRFTDWITYRKIQGNFSGYEKANDLELGSSPISSAIIRHERRNILAITVTHNNIQWTGEMVMEGERTGSIAFQYTDGKYRVAFQGMKKVLISKDYNLVTLIGERPDYGDEYFKRRN
jgi:hypothetical protein